MNDIKINAKFKELIPPLSEDEYRQLEQNILSDGIRDPLVLWDSVLVDGHNRYEIAQKHGLPFETVQMDFEDEDEAMLWIIDNQFGRRNLPEVDAIILSQKKNEITAKMAKEKQSEAGARNMAAYNSGTSYVQMDKTRESINTRDAVAKGAGVSAGTVARFEQIQKKRPELIEDIRKGEMTIGKAYNTLYPHRYL